MKPTDLQLTYKKVLSFNETQKKALKKLKEYDVNVNEFIRIAIREKLTREWKQIKQQKDNYCPF